MKQDADYIGHTNECWDGQFWPNGKWGSRRIGGPFNDVDAYGTREAAEQSVVLCAKYNLPAYELVYRVNDVWCNVW